MIAGERDPEAGDLDDFQARLGHRFADPRLLVQALTHASMAGAGADRAACNERLEFLGDRVLGLVIAHLLFEQFAGESEGALARRYAVLVRREALTRVAAGIGVGDVLRLSRGEDEAGGRGSPGPLADACEAVIGALYLDGGLPAAAAFVRRHWQTLVDEEAAPPQDAKTRLQEWAQGRGSALPCYREAAREGPAHAPMFSVEVTVEGIPPVIGVGPSKRSAEQAAAEAAIALVEARSDGCPHRDR
ncbi:MAG: ribonuclease III [Rhodospirillales bacterium]